MLKSLILIDVIGISNLELENKLKEIEEIRNYIAHSQINILLSLTIEELLEIAIDMENILHKLEQIKEINLE